MSNKIDVWKLVDGYEYNEDPPVRRDGMVRKLKKDKESYKKENKRREVDDEWRPL